MDFATLAGVKQLVPFHHDPDHTDADLDRLTAQAIEATQPDYRIAFGMEGATFRV
jgi:phosphoribosyl 1,2-cyclic phosphodiesterase